MAREIFIQKNFNDEHERIIEHANELLEEYHAGGFIVTLRTLYYQFVAEECWFPNNLQSYKRFGDIISKARLAGRIDWDLLSDSVRKVEELARWDSPTHIMEAVVEQYREDLWKGQELRFHIRIEKDAQIGVIRPVCERWRVPFIACRGNTSQSEAYAAGKLFEKQIRQGLRPIVIYAGDHDPSGMDMTRDNVERLALFAREDIEVRRICLNRDQIDDLRLPGNPAKVTDSRAGLNRDGSIRPGSYIDLHGFESWELDALKPQYLDDLISAEISAGLDLDLFEQRQREEEHNQGILRAIYDRWDEVEELFGGDSE